MARQVDKRLLVVAVLAVAGILGAFIILQQDTGETSYTVQTNTTTTTTPRLGEGPKTYTVNLAPGTILSYSSYYEASFRGNTTSGWINYTAVILDVQWPMTTVNYTIVDTNQSQAAPVALPNLALPVGMLGEDTLTIPLVIPGAQTGACVELKLTGERTYTVGNESIEAYVYRFSYNASGIIVEGTISYDKVKGVAVEFNTSISDPVNDLSTFNSQILTGIKPAGTVGVATPADWICKPPISSDLRFTIEGTYKGRGLDYQPVSTLEIREAIQDKAFILIISKDDQQLTAELWKNFLKASIAFQDKTDFYVIVLGPLSPREQVVFANYILEQAGAVESNVLIYMEGGAAQGKVYSIGGYEDIVDLIRVAYPDP